MKDKLINFKNTVFSFIKTNKKTVIIVAIALIILILAIILVCNRTEIGNTSGNLNNLGFSVKKGNWIYYLGSKDSTTDGIYKVNLNNNKQEKISSDYGLYVNKSGKYIYYLDRTSGNNIVRIKTNGENRETIVQDVDSAKVMVIDNWIYYFKESKLYKVRTNGEDKQILLNSSIGDYEIQGNWIYYSYINNSKYVIAKMNKNGEDESIIDNEAERQFFVDNNYIYYIYENNNEGKIQYELYKIKTNGKNKQKIADLDNNIQLDSVNFSDNKIFYTKSDENKNFAIYSIGLDGKNENKITDVKNAYTKINIHDSWIYYTDENENGDSEMFIIKTNGKDKKALSI